MPYSTIADLPESVRNALPKHALDIFLSAFNSAYEKYKDEERCFKIAWGAVKNAGYIKGEDGKWQKIQHTAIYSPASFLSRDREAILQTLDRKVKGIFLNQDAFKDSKWGGIPLIFAQDHPNDIMLMTDPEKALADVKGRFVGSVKSTRIETVGHPRLMGLLDVTDDEVNTLIDEGRISLSTSLFANSTAKLTKILPTHVLLFIETDKNRPGDEGSWILNLEQEPYGKAKIKAAAKKYGIEISHKETEIQMEEKEIEEQAKQLEFLSKEKEVLVAEKQTLISENEKLKTTVLSFEAEKAVQMKQTQETRWQTIRKALPVGLTYKAEDEAKLRIEFEADAAGFTIQHLVDFKQPEGTEKEGVQFQSQETDDEAKEDAVAAEELREIGGMNRRRG